MGSDLIAREYQADDWPMIEGWLSLHQSERVKQGLLPPVGVIVERGGQPCAALWCHLSVNIGVAFLEAPVSLPGMALTESRAAFEVALGAIEAICRTHDYGLLVANTLPGIARFLERQGFTRDGDRVQLIKVLN